jgi:hypothetical protein
MLTSLSLLSCLKSLETEDPPEETDYATGRAMKKQTVLTFDMELWEVGTFLSLVSTIQLLCPFQQFTLIF